MHFQRKENPFPATGDAVYRKHVGGGPSHGRRQYAQKIGKDRACCPRDILAVRQTDPQADILITILLNRSRRRSNNSVLCHAAVIYSLGAVGRKMNQRRQGAAVNVYLLID